MSRLQLLHSGSHRDSQPFLSTLWDNSLMNKLYPEWRSSQETFVKRMRTQLQNKTPMFLSLIRLGVPPHHLLFARIHVYPFFVFWWTQVILGNAFSGKLSNEVRTVEQMVDGDP